MGLRDRLRKLEAAAEQNLLTFWLRDGTTARFHEDAVMECFAYEMARGRRHYFGDEPGPAHPIVEALRDVSEAELERAVKDQGTMLGHVVGEDKIIRGERERPGPPVRETSPGVYE